MKAIIPVAGTGTRLLPHTLYIPKALLHVAGKPILAHIIDELVALEISEVVLIVGHLAARIEEFAVSRYGSLRLHFVPQAEPLGNGHAVFMARKHLDRSPVVIIFGDTIIKGDLAELVRSPRSMVGVKQVPDPRRLGVVEMDNSGNVNRLIEKPENPATNLAVVGAYFIRNSVALRLALEQQVAEGRQTRGEYWLTEGLQLLVDAGEKMGVFRVEHWYDCGTVESLLQANRELLELEPPPIRSVPTANVIAPSYVDPSATIVNSTIGPCVSIAEMARVVNSVIRDSIIGPHALVEDSHLVASLIGERAAVSYKSGEINIADGPKVG